SQVPARSGASGAEVAAAILDRAGIRDVEIVAHDEMLGDHYDPLHKRLARDEMRGDPYDPLHKRLVLSQQNYYGQSVAALGVSAHECGHAIQHAQAYGPLHMRMAAVGATQFAQHIVL